MEKVLKNGEQKAAIQHVSFCAMFRLLLNDTGLKPSFFARELNRERSLMYKWLSGAISPPDSYFPGIVSIVKKHVSKARQHILEKDLRLIVERSGVSRDIREEVLSATSLEELLFECLHLSLIPERGTEPSLPANDGIRHQALLIFGGLFAAIAGGFLWNTMNRIFMWPYYMGSSGENLRGFHALVWASVTTIPIPLPLLVLYRTEKRKGFHGSMVLFVATGIISAFSFHALDFRGMIENAGFGYHVQEFIIALIFSVMLAVPPLLAATLSRGRITLLHLCLFFVPVIASLSGLGFTFLIDRPLAEIIQLRGFVAGFLLRLSVFFSLFRADRLQYCV